MDVSDIETALDMRIIITYRGQMPISEFSRNKNMSFKAAIMFAKDTMEVSYFVPEHLEDNREVSIFLAQNRVKKQNKTFFLTFAFDEPVINRALRAVVAEKRSLVLDDVTLQNGLYHLSFRFSGKEIKSVSEAIMRYIAAIDTVGINYLGKSPGINSILDEAASSFPMTKIEASFTPPSGFTNVPEIKALGDEWVCEARFMSASEGFRAVVLTKEPVKDPESLGINVLDEENRLYEMEIRLPILTTYLNKGYDSKIPRMWRTLHYRDGEFKSGWVIPEVLSTDFVRVLSSTEQDYPEWNLTVTGIRQIGRK